MSAITRGVVAAVLLAGAVAGAAVFPRIFAGPGTAQTPSSAFVLPREMSGPVIVRAQPLPAPAPAVHAPRPAATPVVPVAHA
ncbi:MAG: hypothetical protein KGL94_08675, partial [Acidobacteriota bacterium]|nr:hypothetical protein [Acidobacteriota bacterium]